MSESGSVEEGAKPVESETSPRQKFLEKQFRKGVSGNPSGRPRIEPRVRRYARRYDRRMCRVLASIAEDKSAPVSERRKAAMDLVAIGSGRPAILQEIAGRNGEQFGPLVALNFGGGMPYGQLSPQDAYRMMVEGVLEVDPKHPSFERKAIEAPVPTIEKTEDAS